MNKITCALLLILGVSLGAENFIAVAPYFSFYRETGEYDGWTDGLQYNVDLYTTGVSANGFISFIKENPIGIIFNLNLGLPYRVESEVNEIESSIDLEYPDQYGFDISGLVGIGYSRDIDPLTFNMGIGLSGGMVQYELNSYSKGSMATLGIGGSLQLIYMINEKLGVSLGSTLTFTPFNFDNSLLNDVIGDKFYLLNYSPYLGLALAL